MDQIRVIVVGPFASPSFAAGLRVLLAETGRFDVVEHDGCERLDDVLDDDRPATIILESSDPSGSIDLLESSRNLSVVLVDPVGAKAFIGLDNPGWAGLLKLIETLADSTRTGDRDHPRSRLRVVGRDELAPADPQQSSDDVGPLRAWLDLTLGLQLLSRCRDGEPESVPGWSLRPEDALAALGLPVQASASELRAQLDAEDRRLIVELDGLPTTLATLATTYGLNKQERRLLCLVLAPELDGRYGSAIGVLADDMGVRRPSLTLLAELLGLADGGWELRRDLARTGSLLDRHLIGPEHSSPEQVAVDVGYRPQPAIVAAMLSTTLDRAARTVGARVAQADEIELAPAEAELARVLSRLAAAGGPHLIELRNAGEAAWFERLSQGGGLPLLRGDLGLLDGHQPPHLAVSAWLTLAVLARSALLLTGTEGLDGGQADMVAAALDGAVRDVPLIAIAGSVDRLFGRPTAAVGLDPPTIPVTERANLWTVAAERSGITLADHEAYSLSLELQLDPAEIAACVARCRDEAVATNQPLVRRLRMAAGQMRQPDLPQAVRLVETTFDWDDLVLTDDVKSVLRSIPDHVTFSGRVLTSWGFSARLPYGCGVAALFSGPSGTGKTMAAQVISADLGKELLHVDLSRTISKYIGETEKNIDGVFEAAEQRGAVLLFDEADALFGKRSEVKDAHDRHANVEVAYLLQRLEAFTGVAVLTSNLKQNIDQAFLRRLRFVVDFPLPGVDEREAIWQRSFPADAPLADDIDLAFLARRLKLTGGTIQQVAVHAAFAAATQGGRIHMRHVVAATRRELVKLGMLNMDKTLEERAA